MPLKNGNLFVPCKFKFYYIHWIYRQEKKSIPNVPCQISEIERLKEKTEMYMLHIFNSGDVKSLISLKLIGKKRAADIIQARQEHGPFHTLVDLLVAGLSTNQIDCIFKVINF